METESRRVAEEVRAALVRAALMAYEDSSIQGLCSEGAWEVALAAMRDLDLTRVIAQRSEAHESQGHQDRNSHGH
jgi:hypothetical protein